VNLPVLWTGEEALRVTAGDGAKDWRATGVSIDSRTLEPGDLFVALQGDSRDGHLFIEDAFAKHAAAALVAHKIEAHGPLLVVSDTLAGLRALGQAARARMSGKVIAVTGSVGKTSTKEALRLILSEQGPTHASAASYNNHWGVPLSLARMPQTTAFGVFEIGMNHAGEIAPLARLVQPHVAIVTAVDAVHMEFFATVEAIAEEKGEIFAGLVPGGTAIVNRDSQFYRLLRRKAESYGASRVIGFGMHSEADARLLAIEPAREGSRVTAMISGHPLSYNLGAPGRHWAENSLAVLAAADSVSADLERAAAALARVKPAKGRGVRTRIRVAGGAIELIDESYNANPASMRAALALLGETVPGQGGRRIAVLGDMLELGAGAESFHRDLAPAIERARIDLVFTAGPLMAALDEALPAPRRGAHAERSTDLAIPLTRALKPGDVVMVKGSFGSKMGAVVEALQSRAPQEA